MKTEVYLPVDKEVLEPVLAISNIIGVQVEVTFGVTPNIPATWNDPAEGGELDVTEQHIVLLEDEEGKTYDTVGLELEEMVLGVVLTSDNCERLDVACYEAWDKENKLVKPDRFGRIKFSSLNDLI